MPCMDQQPPPASLLEELDRRQDEVLSQLDELEARIAQLLAEYAPAKPRRPAHPLESILGDAN